MRGRGALLHLRAVTLLKEAEGMRAKKIQWVETDPLKGCMKKFQFHGTHTALKKVRQLWNMRSSSLTNPKLVLDRAVLLCRPAVNMMVPTIVSFSPLIYDSRTALVSCVWLPIDMTLHTFCSVFLQDKKTTTKNTHTFCF